MEFTVRVDFGWVTGDVCALILFGVLYNQAVGWAERRGYIEGFTSLAVALGVAVTLGGIALICWQAALLAAGAFLASGSPMIAGSLFRYIRARDHAKQSLSEVHNGDKTPTHG
jgi:hypothetical protein